MNKDENTCEEIEDTIDNCVIYKDSLDVIECKECDWGFGVDTDTNECVLCN